MNSIIRGSRTKLIAALAAALIVGACSDDNGLGPSGRHNEPVGAEVWLRGTDERLADVHGDHWHGRIQMEVGEGVEVDVRFLNAADQVIALGGDYTVRAFLASGQPSGIISISEHGDHLDIEGLAVGETRIELHFVHDGHTDFITPPLRVVVTEPDHDHEHDPVTAEVWLRGTDERLADIHGDHWHGRIELTIGDDVEVDVRFLNGEGEVITLSGDYSLAAETADGYPAGVIDFDVHGDHLHIEGLAVGETRIVLHFMHDGHADFSTPPLRVVVNAAP